MSTLPGQSDAHGVHHKDGPLAQLRQMADWAREHDCIAFGGAETVGKIARNIDAAVDAVDADYVPSAMVAQAERETADALHDVEAAQADRNMSRSELDDIAELLGFRRDSLSATHGDVIAEVKRRLAEGSPGVMHAVDQAFYDLAIKERDFERQARVRIETERDRLQVALGKVPQEQLARIMAAVAVDERGG